VTLLRADTGFWPILVLWGVAMVMGAASKKKRVAQRPPSEPDTAGPPAAPQLGQLGRALEELKRAEREAAARRPAAVSRATPPPRDDAVREAERAQPQVRAAVAAEPPVRPAARPPAAQRRTPALTRLGARGARGALMLAEIFGRPVSDR